MNIQDKFLSLFGSQNAQVDRRTEPTESKFHLWVKVLKVPRDLLLCGCKEQGGITYTVEKTGTKQWRTECEICGRTREFGIDGTSGRLYARPALLNDRETNSWQVAANDEPETDASDAGNNNHVDSDAECSEEDAVAPPTARAAKGTKAKAPKEEDVQQDMAPVVFRLEERWNVKLLATCMRLKCLSSAERAQLYRIWQGCKEHNGWFSAEYRHSKSTPVHGRLYGNGCQSNVPGFVRRVCMGEFYHDVDMVNAGPTLLLNLCRRYHVSAPRLNEFVENRDAYLSEIMKTCSVNREVAKSVFPLILNGGTVAGWARQHGICDEVAHTLPFLTQFAREAKQISKRLQSQQRFEATVERLRKETTASSPSGWDNRDGRFLATVVFEAEIQVLLAIKEFLELHQFVVGALIHDGLLVQKSNSLTPLLLKHCESWIRGQTGHCIQLKEKPFVATPEDLEKLNGPLYLWNAVEAAQLIVDRYGRYMARDSNLGLGVFLHDKNYWNFERHVVKQTLVAWMREASVFLDQHKLPKQGDCAPTGKNFYLSSRLRDEVLSNVDHLLPLVEKFEESSMSKGYRKLPFANGYWDFITNQFVEGQCPELFFMAAVQRPFPSQRNEVAIQQAYEELFQRPFTDSDTPRYVLRNFARALAGEVGDKQAIFLVGAGDSGKTTIEEAILSAFGDVMVREFSMENLMRSSDDDIEKQLAFVAQHHAARILFSDEVRTKKNKPINSEAFKRILNGGNMRVPCRMLHQNTIRPLVQFRLFVACNGLPDFSGGAQSSIKNRVCDVRFQKHAVRNAPADYACAADEFVADETLKDRIRQPSYRDAILHLVLDHYAADLGLKPAAVLQESENHVGDDSVEDFLGDMLEYWSEEQGKQYAKGELAPAVVEDWSVKCKDVIVEVVHYTEESEATTRNRVGTIMRKHGVVAVQKKHRGMNQKMYVGARRKAD